MIFYRALAWLPLSILHALAWLAYLLLYHIVRYRRDVVRQNLARAFPEKSEQERRVLAREFYWRLCQVAFEIIKTQRMSQADFRKRVKIINPELVQASTNNFTESAIVVGMHQGNWEWMLHGASLDMGIPIDPVYKPLHNKTADKLIYDIRSKFGSRPLAMAESSKDILRRRKEFRLFAMIADQSPIRSERSHWGQFMNQPAAFYQGAEIIAKMTRFPVLFVRCHRVRSGYYEIEFQEVANPPYDKASTVITERYIKLAEQAIRSQPESWLWTNRRWKRDPLAEQALEQAEQP
ncbi:MAG: lysophospholipid acyltransferase family protein [Halioglobus sp.]